MSNFKPNFKIDKQARGNPSNMQRQNKFDQDNVYEEQDYNGA